MLFGDREEDRIRRGSSDIELVGRVNGYNGFEAILFVSLS
jgi:hypothetical protein